MADKVDFYIFRHGETDINRQKRWQGAGTDVDLNQAGSEQALSLVGKLIDKKLEIIYSSPLIRAHHTAKIAASGLGIDVVVCPALRECHYGVAEGQPIEEIVAKYGEISAAFGAPKEHLLDVRFPGGESLREGRERILTAINDIAQKGYQRVGLAIHGGTMNNLLSYLGVDNPKVPNCGCIHLVYDGDKLRLDGAVF